MSDIVNESIFKRKDKKQNTRSNMESPYYNNGFIKVTSNVWLPSLAAEIANGSYDKSKVLEIVREWELRRRRTEVKRYSFADQIEEIAAAKFTRNEILKLIDADVGGANSEIDEVLCDTSIYSKLKGKTLTEVYSFNSDYVLLYCSEDSYLYNISYEDPTFVNKLTIDQLLRAVNIGWNDIQKFIKDPTAETAIEYKYETITENVEKYLTARQFAHMISTVQDKTYFTVTEADVEKRSKEASKDIATRITMLDQLKAKLSSDNLVYLQTYEDAAKACNPIGLLIRNHKSVDIAKYDKLYKSAMEMISKKEKEGLAITDIPTVKQWLSDNIRDNEIYNEMYTIIYGDKKPNTDKFIIEEKNHKVTKSDIQNAIKILRGAGDEFVKIMNDLKQQQRYFDAQLHTNVDAGQMSGTLNQSIDEYRQTIRLNIAAIKKLLITHVLNTKTKFAKIDQINARVIIRKAAKYNPRSYKESMEELDYIEYTFESTIDNLFDINE